MKVYIAISIFTAVTAAIFLISLTSAKAQEIKAPVVVELFTSQSCSSCPPADRILGELADNENVIALSCHVTYWNHLHWKDTLSQEFCTKRQRDYSASIGKRGSYTPQIVINGTHDVVGNRNGQVQNLVAEISQKEALLPIGLSQFGSTLEVNVPQSDIAQNAQVLLISYHDKHVQKIPSGENKGRTVAYTNPVQNIETIGFWNGAAESYSLKLDQKLRNHAVILQNRKTGQIIGARKI